jgi:hypothetical protein
LSSLASISKVRPIEALCPAFCLFNSAHGSSHLPPLKHSKNFNLIHSFDIGISEMQRNVG